MKSIVTIQVFLLVLQWLTFRYPLKTYVLDINIHLNNDQYINLELQITNLGNWPERSLTYLCRSFDQLQRGEEYIDVHTTIHIGILDFNLPDLTPEFYSEYKMMNTKNHEIYSDKLVLRVLNLKAVDDDTIIKEPADLYYWAKLFKAQSWEELKMLAEKNSYIEDAVVTLHQMSEDEKIREQCRGREKYNWDMASVIEMGRKEGLTEGLSAGENRLSALINLLLEKGLTGDIPKVTTDSSYREELYKKYQECVKKSL